MTRNAPLWDGSTGSITAGCSNPADMSLRRSQGKCSTVSKSRPKRPDSAEWVRIEPGAVGCDRVPRIRAETYP